MTTITNISNSDTVSSPLYHVTLPDFYGPMDILLTLITQEDMEITKISLAQVTDQYLDYIRTLEEITPDVLTDFLVVAAKLILIKSQVLLPKPPASIIEEEEDTGDDLVQQLKDYKRFKQLAAQLNKIQLTQQYSFVRTAPLPKIEPKLDLSNLNIDNLLKAVRHALQVKPEPTAVDTVVSRQFITIGHQINLIKNKLNSNKNIFFSQLLTETYSKVEVIVTLLAVLELIKRQVIDVNQPEDFADITIIKKDDATLSEEDWSALSQLKDVT